MNRLLTFVFILVFVALITPSLLASEKPEASVTGKGIESSTLFLSVPPETLLATKPNHPRKFIEPVKRRNGLYPNWANLRNETIAQGGFQPGASQSDSAGGMRIGVSFMHAKHPGNINPKWKPVRDSAKV